VFCVEHGRWTGSAQFRRRESIVHPSVRESAAVDQVSNEVWESVATANVAPLQRSRARIAQPNIQGAIAGNGRTEATRKSTSPRRRVSIDICRRSASAGSTAQPWV